MDAGGGVRDRGTIMLGALAGALAGGVVAYLYFTESGRRLREDLEPRLEGVARELARAKVAAGRARSAVDESWESVRRVDASLRGSAVPGGR
jgi:hypothetical protein